jgi:hypothetical protein
VVEFLTRKEIRCRNVNEQIERLTASAPAGGRLYVCECSNPGCTDAVEITIGEYEAVRGRPTCFVVKPGHERREIERIIEENDRFSIVEKVGGAAVLAAAHDPRGV